MFKAETPGPMKDIKMTPDLAETSKGLWGVYVLVSIACIVSYRLAGMDWFDAFCHGFSTMGLSSFSTHDASFGFFNSPAIETVSIVSMLITGMNFGILFLAVHARSLKPYLHDPEVRWFIGICIASDFSCWRSVGTAKCFVAVVAFGFIYMVSIVSLTLLLVFTGLDAVTAFTVIVASVNNTGPGLGSVGASAMLLGCLEIFTLLIALTPDFWRR